MKNAVVVESNDIKKILAEKFNVPEKKYCEKQIQLNSHIGKRRRR